MEKVSIIHDVEIFIQNIRWDTWKKDNDNVYIGLPLDKIWMSYGDPSANVSIGFGFDEQVY
jgi:hypothetical protein